MNGDRKKAKHGDDYLYSVDPAENRNAARQRGKAKRRLNRRDRRKARYESQRQSDG